MSKLFSDLTDEQDKEVRLAMADIVKEYGGGYRFRFGVEGHPTTYIGFSGPKLPQNKDDWIDILEVALEVLRAPDMPDPEVLGKHSPNI